MVGEHPAIVIEPITRLREDLRPDWPRPAQAGGSYRVEITGEPSYFVDICPSSRKGDHNHAAIVAAAGRIANAIPAVVEAAPGILTTSITTAYVHEIRGAGIGQVRNIATALLRGEFTSVAARHWTRLPARTGQQGRVVLVQILKRPAKARNGRSALVMIPAGAATTDVRALSAGSPVTVMPMEAKFCGFDRSNPLRGKIMCLL